MLTCSKIFNKNIPAETLTNDWRVEDRITWVREDVANGHITSRKDRIKAMLEIMVMQYAPKLYDAYTLHKCKKYNMDIVDFNIDIL